MASSRSRFRRGADISVGVPPGPARRWGRCCLREAWPFRGAPLGTVGPVLLGRRLGSKLDEGEDWLGAGEWVVAGGAEADLPRADVEVMVGCFLF